MYKLPLFIFLIFALCVLNLHQAHSYSPQGRIETSVSATVGTLHLSVYGFASPLASIILTSNGILLDSTVADDLGNFAFILLPIKTGFSDFCLTAVDFKKIGESQACLHIPPAQEDVVIRDIFLPPTIAVAKKIVKEGDEVQIFGYTMPNATVTIRINNNLTITVTADYTGYYTYTLKNVKAGKYSLFATAKLNKKPSLEPKKPATFEALSKIGEAKVTAKNFLQQLWELLTTSWIGFALLCLLLLLIIAFLLYKLKPFGNKQNGQTFRATVPLPKKQPSEPAHLHHDWFLDLDDGRNSDTP